MRVYLKDDDLDQHGAGCNCGLCDRNGRSFGVAIFNLDPFGITYESELTDDHLDQLLNADPEERVYAPSIGAAFHNALLLCQLHDWQLLELDSEKEDK